MVWYRYIIEVNPITIQNIFSDNQSNEPVPNIKQNTSLIQTTSSRNSKHNTKKLLMPN